MDGKKTSPKGHTWSEIEKEIYAPKEIAASDLRVALMIESVKATVMKYCAL
jgi:hypothetical protein